MSKVRCSESLSVSSSRLGSRLMKSRRATPQRSRRRRKSLPVQRTVAPSAGRQSQPETEVVAAQRLGRSAALHDVVGVPSRRTGAYRAAVACQGRGHRRETAAAAAVAQLQLFAQVGREDVALDERVAQYGDAHGCAAGGVGQSRAEAVQGGRRRAYRNLRSG